MGLLNFWNKKALDRVPAKPQDNFDLSTDLPSIDGGTLDLMPKLPDNSGNDLNSLSAFDLPTQASLSDSLAMPVSAPVSIPSPLESKSIPSNTINISPLPTIPASNLNMPSLSDAPLISEPIKPAELIKSAEPAVQQQKPEEKVYLDVEDLKKLFLNDDWKEPDWNTFEPYHEDTIDKPHLEDFGTDLPNFTEEESISAPEFLEKPTIMMPMELFIRGREYNKVLLELDQMTKSIVKVDSKLGSYEVILKREESLFLESKNQMEHLYKKLTQIDKKFLYSKGDIYG